MYISLNKLIFIYFHLSYTSNIILCPSFNFFRKFHQYLLGSTSYFKARNRSLDSPHLDSLNYYMVNLSIFHWRG
ncbi:unnamed protein product [Meloidogyne enterolobii]|uniref:Uncharacterized protein n=1 Tax=Meloidogyne enterolobii TaxID=390850 RepID=A0ACB1ASC3_MELEN